MGIPSQGCISEEESGRWQPSTWQPVQAGSHAHPHRRGAPSLHRARAGARLLSPGSYQCQSLSAWRWPHVCHGCWWRSMCHCGERGCLLLWPRLAGGFVQHTGVNISAQQTGKAWRETSVLRGAHNTKALSMTAEDGSAPRHSALEAGGEPCCKQQGGKFNTASCKVSLTIYPCGQRSWRRSESQFFKCSLNRRRRLLKGWQGDRKHCWLDAVMKEIEGQR